jgi:hypothetical protein
MWIERKLNVSKVVQVTHNAISFDDGHELYSKHDTACCEEHYLCFHHLSLKDFDGLEFDLKGNFFERVVGFGIRLIPINGFPVSIPAYASNSGYYSDELLLVLANVAGDVKHKVVFDITDCNSAT